MDFSENVGEGLVLLNVGGTSEARTDGFLLLQRPVDDDRVDQLLGLNGEGLGLQIAITTGPDVGQLGRRFSAGDVLEHRVALIKITERS